MTPPESEDEPLSETSETSATKPPRADYDSDQDLMLHFKLTEYAIVSEITKVAHTIEKQRAAEIQFKASILEEVRALTTKVDTTMIAIHDSISALQRAASVASVASVAPTPTAPNTTEPINAPREIPTEEESPSAKQQVGAGIDFEGQDVQVGGFCSSGSGGSGSGGSGSGGSKRREDESRPQYPTQPKPESTPISVEELASIKHDDNLKYLWIYPTLYHDTPYKMRVASLFLTDAEEILKRGGVILPHKKHAKDWDQFVRDRQKWAAKQHFTHCREKS